MATTPTELPALMDLPAVALRLGVNERHIRRLVAERRIPYIKWGHLIRFDPAEVAVWLNANRRPAQRRAHGLPGQKAS
jgi:excisionase family DNA binding protein